jgi:DNA-binding transcriptional regulator YhcF (GntR family)
MAQVDLRGRSIYHIVTEPLMPRRVATLPLALSPRGARISAHHWLCSALRGAILERRLTPGTRLPATRELAREYALARGTVVNAFEQLESEGYLKMRGGSGTFVNDVLPDELLQIGRRTETAAVARPSAGICRVWPEAPERFHPFRTHAHAPSARTCPLWICFHARCGRRYRPAGFAARPAICS